jgi:hypothetical protein
MLTTVLPLHRAWTKLALSPSEHPIPSVRTERRRRRRRHKQAHGLDTMGVTSTCQNSSLRRAKVLNVTFGYALGFPMAVGAPDPSSRS